jgi:S1-C subfamily serine protease
LNCDEWHLSLAGGYAIAENTIATCDHVIATKTKMRDGFLVAVDHQGNVACGTAILARSAAMDAAIIKVAGAEFTPVPLNSDVKQGAASYCFSQPLRQQGYFSAGIVNRFFREKDSGAEAPDSIDALRHLRVNFSNEWAPGSSGSPLLDSAGNIIGHVSTISGLSSGKNRPPLLMLRTGIPALAVQQLAKTTANPAEIKRIANLDSQVSKTAVKPKKSTPECPAADP